MVPGQPMSSLREAFQAINKLKADRVVEDYAVAGAMALVFWTEPVATFDLDVLVLLPEPSSGLISLDAIYRWAEAQGYPEQAESTFSSRAYRRSSYPLRTSCPARRFLRRSHRTTRAFPCASCVRNT